MDWSEKYNLDPPPSAATDPMFVDESSDALLKEYELLLQEYNDIFANDGYDQGAYFDGTTGGLYYERDDGYEGGLHMSLGVLYSMSRGGDEENDVLAASHLEQAIRLYEMSGEEGQNMASVKFNLANLRLRSGDYRESAKLYKEALDIFQTIGTLNPLLGSFGMDSINILLQQQTEDAERASAKPAQSAKETKSSAEKFEKDSNSEILIDIESFLKQNSSLKDEL